VATKGRNRHPRFVKRNHCKWAMHGLVVGRNAILVAQDKRSGGGGGKKRKKRNSGGWRRPRRGSVGPWRCRGLSWTKYSLKKTKRSGIGVRKKMQYMWKPGSKKEKGGLHRRADWEGKRSREGPYPHSGAGARARNLSSYRKYSSVPVGGQRRVSLINSVWYWKEGRAPKTRWVRELHLR